MRKVGIESIAFHSTGHYIDLVDLANARNIDPNKYTKGLGQKTMSIATPLEDTVYLAINAGKKALQNFDIDPGEIGTMVVGTETGVDHSKPVAAYVHQALGLRSSCQTYETKHACFGAMAAISSAHDWIACGRANGSKALIIAADIARYPIGDPGEPTQGAGGVAMVVSDKPNLLYFDQDIHGNYTKQVMDFWRPLYSKEAFVDGHYSIECYLDALSFAIDDALTKTKVPQLFCLESLQACLYHVPFIKMAVKAHHRHFESNSGTKIDKDDERLELVRTSFNQRVAPFLTLNEIVGNVYTGSVFLSLIDLLRKSTSDSIKQFSLYSYGSGCAASYSLAYPTPGFETYRDRIDPEPELNNRVKMSIKEYEEMADISDSLNSGDTELFDPKNWNLGGDYYYLGNKCHKRQYSGIDYD